MSIEFQQLQNDIASTLLDYKRFGYDYESLLKHWEEIIGIQRQRGCLPKEFENPLGVQLEITYSCNLRCIQCYNNSGQQINPELTKGEWVNVTKKLCEMGVFECVISGGEPLMYNGLFDILDTLKEYDVKIILITNGWFLKKRVVSKLAKYDYSWLQVSIDGATAKTHDRIRGVRGSWKRAIVGAKMVADEGIPLVIANVCMRSNLHELKDLIDIAGYLGACQIITGEGILVGRGSNLSSELPLTDDERKLFFDIVKEKRREWGEATAVTVSLPPEISLRFYALMPTRVLLIRPNGDVKLGCIEPFKVGNVRDDDLKTLWKRVIDAKHHPEVLKFIRHVRNNADLLTYEHGIPHVDGDIPLYSKTERVEKV